MSDEERERFIVALLDLDPLSRYAFVNRCAEITTSSDHGGGVLVQSHPGPIGKRPEIDPLMSIHAAFALEDAGIPLLDHVFINAQGHALSMRKQGYFDEVRSMVNTIRDVALEIVGESGIPGYEGEPKPPIPEQRWVWDRRR